MCTETHRSRRGWFSICLLLAIAVAAGSMNAAPSAEKDPETAAYAERFKAAEDALATGEQVYLVCDLKASRIRLKIKGVTVRDYRYAPIEDSGLVEAFRDRARAADSVIHPLTRLHLYEAARKLNDTVLGIVSEATNASAELLQRFRPERLAVTFEGRLGLEVSSDVDGTAVSLGSNWAETAKGFAERVLGSRMLEVRLEPDDAMSFYGACQSKPPLLIAP